MYDSAVSKILDSCNPRLTYLVGFDVQPEDCKLISFNGIIFSYKCALFIWLFVPDMYPHYHEKNMTFVIRLDVEQHGCSGGA